METFYIRCGDFGKLDATFITETQYFALNLSHRRNYMLYGTYANRQEMRRAYVEEVVNR